MACMVARSSVVTTARDPAAQGTQNGVTPQAQSYGPFNVDDLSMWLYVSNAHSKLIESCRHLWDLFLKSHYHMAWHGKSMALPACRIINVSSVWIPEHSSPFAVRTVSPTEYCGDASSSGCDDAWRTGAPAQLVSAR